MSRAEPQSATASDHAAPPGAPDDLPELPARWLMIGFAFLATVINYLDRQTLSMVAHVLCGDFRMNNETYGLVLAAFMLAYTIMNGVSGPLLDRLGTRLGYALCMAWWSTAGMLHALAQGPWSLGLFRFLLGMGEAGNWPAAVKVVAEWFPQRQRALASGIFNSGAAIGAILAPWLVSRLADTFGWKGAFVAIGALGYLWLAAWWMVYDTPPQIRHELQTPPASPWRLLRTRFLVWFTISKIFLDPVWYFYIFWFPKYLSSAFGLSTVEIGNIAWIPFAAAGVGSLVGGWLTGLGMRLGMTVPVARKASVAISALLMTTGLTVGYSASVTTATALVSVAALGYCSYNANALAFPADVFPRNLVGSVWGLASLGSGLGGMIFSWASGHVIDAYGYGPAFVACGILPLVAGSMVLFLLGPLRPLREFQFPCIPAEEPSWTHDRA